ncbi:hypothetical protein KUCAC02_006392 [Chaenocephalus aceratus]|uniref:Uncharacterized protein n=1 Tax=Chaenocephalus aceratus TaxID=36190 RepID=A0ACB9VRP4_CHAAC|nr:hypothetical protein KUCAC02_006392 [Chaenocephalus aceratus]
MARQPSTSKRETFTFSPLSHSDLVSKKLTWNFFEASHGIGGTLKRSAAELCAWGKMFQMPSLFSKNSRDWNRQWSSSLSVKRKLKQKQRSLL